MAQLLALVAREALALALVDLGLLTPDIERLFRDAQIVKAA